MDTGALVFTILLVFIGLFLVFKYLPTGAEVSEDEEEEVKDSGARYQALRDANRMRRRRSQVWWKVENLYSELRQRTAVDEIATDPADSPSSQESKKRAEEFERLTSSQVSEAFESFLRRTK